MVNPAETLNADDLLLIYYYEEIIDEELDECFESSSGELWKEGTTYRLYYDDCVCSTTYHGVIEIDVSLLPTVYQFFESDNTNETFAMFILDKGGKMIGSESEHGESEDGTLQNLVIPESDSTIELPY